MTKYQDALKEIFGDPAIIGDPFSTLGASHPTQAQVVQYWLWLTYCERMTRADGDLVKAKKVRLDDDVKNPIKAKVGAKLKSHFETNFPSKTVLGDQEIMNTVRDLIGRVNKYENNCNPYVPSWVDAQKAQFQSLVNLEHKAIDVEIEMVRFLRILLK